MKKSLLKISVATAMVALAGCTTASSDTTVTPENATEVIAVIGEDSITVEEFYEQLKSQAGSSVLRSMIIEKVLEKNLSNAEELQASANEEVDEQIQSAGGEAAFQELLTYRGLGTVSDYRQSVYIRNLFQEIIRENTDTSDEALLAYYESSYETPMEAQHILVSTEEEANEILQRLEDGEDFDALAKELSLDSTASNGGLLSPFYSGQMVSEFEEAVKSVANGELVSEPVQSQYGWHIIRTINNGEKLPFEEVKEQVLEQYLQTQYQDLTIAYSIVGKLIREEGVEIKDPELQKALDELLESIDAAQAAAEAASQETTSAEEETTQEETTSTEETTQEETTEED